MRFVAPNPLTVVIENPIEEPDPYHVGRQIISKPGITAHFRTGDYTHAEKEFALRRFRFQGRPVVDPNSMEPVDVSYRISTFDTSQQNYDDETRKMVEGKLLTAFGHGSEFEHFESPKLPPPWAGYDKLRSAKRIVDLVKETGSDPEDVIAYERENDNRLEVIEALGALLVPEEAGVTVISA